MALTTSLLVTSVGTAASIQQSRKAQRLGEESDAVANAQREIANQREIRQTVAASKLQRAQLVAAGETQTGSFGGSSSVTGALGAAQTQTASNIGFARQISATNSVLNNLGTQSNRAQSNAQTFGAIAGLPSAFGFDVRSVVRDRASKPDKNQGFKTGLA